MFILPVKRDGGHFIVVGQFKGKTALITHLEDYKKSAEAADPYLALTVHDEFVQSKDIALIRGDLEPGKLRKVPPPTTSLPSPTTTSSKAV
jgi:ATP synthase mitochondrial F1 complex assembly factor 1